MEQTKELTYAQKVYALQKANPKLTDSECCILLGISMEKLIESRKKQKDFYGNIFGDFSSLFYGTDF